MNSAMINYRRKSLNLKLTFALLALTAVSIAILTIDTNGNNKEYRLLPHDCRPSDVFIPEDGCVPDSSTAISIAEAVWLSFYGDSIYERKPFRAELVGDTLWIVAGSMPKNMLGGVPYIEIQKVDGKVLGIGHGK